MYICTCLSLCVPHVHSRSLWKRVPGLRSQNYSWLYKLPNVGAGNWGCILCKSNKRLNRLATSPAPRHVFVFCYRYYYLMWMLGIKLILPRQVLSQLSCLQASGWLEIRKRRPQSRLTLTLFWLVVFGAIEPALSSSAWTGSPHQTLCSFSLLALMVPPTIPFICVQGGHWTLDFYTSLLLKPSFPPGKKDMFGDHCMKMKYKSPQRKKTFWGSVTGQGE